MIKLAENPSELLAYKKTDIFSIRIMSLLNAYGTAYDFARFYLQIDDYDEENVTAIISKLDGDYTVSHYDDFNEYEMKEFFHTLGYSTVLSDERLRLSNDFSEGIVMATLRKTEKHLPYVEIDNYPRLMDLFNLDDYNNTDFEAWYVDVNHRIRHNAAKAVTLNVNGEIVSSAMLSSIYNDDAVLSAVNTAPEYRRLGYGSTLVSEIICDVKGKVYLMREADKNEAFYKKLGFENTGIWRMYK